MFQTIIVEDDPFAQEMLTDLIQKNFSEYSVMKRCASVEEAASTIPGLNPGLVFLDMELPDGKGFDVLEKLDQINFEVIITTMHDSYMLQAIKHSAVDYLMKPVNKEALAGALERFEKKTAEARKRKPSDQKISRISKLALPTQEGLVLIDVSDIVRLESEGAYTKFITRNGEVLMTSKSLGHYEDQLIQQLFFRVHHSHLINLAHVRRYIKGEGGYVIMTDNSKVDVSRRKKEEFLKALGL